MLSVDARGICRRLEVRHSLRALCVARTCDGGSIVVVAVGYSSLIPSHESASKNITTGTNSRTDIPCRIASRYTTISAKMRSHEAASISSTNYQQ